MKISMIACVGKNLELGKNNNLIWHLPNDLKFFKEMTLNHPVLMGKNTFKSLPGVLKNRENIVLTSSNEQFPDGVIVLHSIEEFFDKYKDTDDEVFIIGGASIYKQFLKYAKTLYLTEVDEVSSDADVFFPTFDKSLYEKEIIKSNSDNGISYQHVKYRRV